MLYALIILIGGLLSYFGPWWIIAPVCFALCWWKATSGRQAFWTSALASTTLWVGYGGYLYAISGVNLADKVMGIFTTGAPALAAVPGIVLALTVATLIVVLVGGVAGLAGLSIRRFFDTVAY
ncbi:hypothetical protein [Parapedobacter koreensis]|uniref:Apolipoprotein N-acyltransferase n=1 Tax=Parapedobacter koreensis TaxID=332977 RepID=A0A1H7MIP6_9SPHI|nr:hypothetical protein [Parapedobacter koreensis]SEL11166.1 hypothetical protein SAMN05421740_103538 [Parapedobacter koreensis]